MNVPKWLIPALSIVAALAVAVSMAFVGANFASKTTTEVAAKTEVDPVIAPAATGLTTDQVKALLASKTPLSSPKIGNKRVTLPGALPKSSALSREVARIATGDQPGAASSTASSTATPSPSALPSSSTVGVEAYDPPTTSDDPCATAEGAAPAGCPQGLHSVIFADTAPPALRSALAVFDPLCGTTPVHADPTGNRVNVSILVTTNRPASLVVNYTGFNDPQHTFTGLATDGHTGALWTSAVHANTAVADLPAITTCIVLPNLLPATVYQVDVQAYLPGVSGPTIEQHALFNTTGLPTEQGLGAQAVGSDGLVVYGDYRASEQLGIRVFSGPAAATTTCAAASTTLHELSPADIRPAVLGPSEVTAANEPTDVNHRLAMGFVVPGGAQLLLCGRWWNAGSSPSWARTTPLRISTVFAQAPDEILPHVTVTGSGIYDNPGADTVTASIATTEGERCGSAVIYRGQFGQGSGNGTLNCSLSGAGTVNASTDFLSNVGFDGDLRITIDVRYTDGHSGTYSEVLPTSEARPATCDDSDVHDLCGHLDDVYQVGIPYYYLINGHDPNDGQLDVDVSWVKVGSTGMDQWLVEPQALVVAPPAGDPSYAAPLLNTDNRVVAVTTTGPQTVSASFDLESNAPADYTMSLTGISGPGCAATSAPLTVHGHVDGHTTAVIPGLCFGALYWASVTLTNAHGTTTWGHANPSAGWNGDLLHTPYKSETLFVQETVNAGAGHVIQYADFTIGGQEIDPTHVPASCYSSGNLSADQHTFRLPTTTTLHIHYELKPGLRTSSGGCQLIAGGSGSPTTVDADFPINLTTLAANPTGMTITQGPVTVLVREFVTP